jgi:transcriptional regulator with XRE-family HTH domain
MGAHVQTLRLTKGLSLRALAEQAGLTASFLSKIERDQVSPSITSLRSIALALGVPVFQLLLEPHTPDRVVRAGERRKLVTSTFTYELLTPDLDRKMEVLQGRLKPGLATSSEPLGHDTDEFLTVLQGRLRLEIGADIYVLETGDSVYYDGRVPHRITALGRQELVFLSCLTPAGF